MRNLAAYPLTLDEIIAVLDRLADDVLAEHRIGDMRPLILIEAASLLRTNRALLGPQVHRIAPGA